MTAKKTDDKPAETEPDLEELDPYTDYAEFPCVLTLATGELVGSPSIQSTHHYSPKLDQDVPVVGRLAR